MTHWRVVWLGLVFAAAPFGAAAQASKAAETPPAAAPAPSYAGSDACKICHEDIYNTFAKTAHEQLETSAKKGWMGKACEACHGPGQAHTEGPSADNIRNPAKLAPGAVDQLCLTCHLNQPTQVGRLESSHARDQIACTSCHKIHSADHPLVVRQADAINTQCRSCHLNVWAQFQRPFHHKLPEGDMSCVDCHNPHGSILPAMQQTFAANDPGCIKCHGDKRGPFTFEHEPLRLQGCQACHEPHGSANPRMLTRAQVRFVCLECHANLPGQFANGTAKIGGVVPPAFHDLNQPVFQNCTVCHQKIHGSYVDRNLLK